MESSSKQEKSYRDEFSWDQLEEDEFGRLRTVNDAMRQKTRRERLMMSSAHTAQVRRGMIRFMELVIDLSKAASIADMRPLRSGAMFGAARMFIRSFFDENPLSQLGIVVMRDGVAFQLTELSSSPEMHIEKLKSSLDTGGDASIANALDVCVDCLKNIPPYGHRETVFLLASLSTCDPGDIMTSIKQAMKHHIRVSVVGVAAEVYICRFMTDKTNGTYGIALDQEHMEQLLLEHAVPPPWLSEDQQKVSLVQVGFPSQASTAPGAACFVGAECSLKAGCYICPRCQARTAEVPSECHICSLTLIASPHLARSYHHLFPVPLFKEIDSGTQQDGTCFACHFKFRPKSDMDSASDISQCVLCSKYFCLDCDEYIHAFLHSCPGCCVVSDA